MKNKKMLVMENGDNGKINMVKVEGTSVRMFASFRNKEEMNARIEDLLNKIPKKYKADLWLWIGQYESTLVEGFQDEQ